MSRLYVRNLVRSWCQGPTVTVPFYDTVNLEQDPADQVWFTAAFDAWDQLVTDYCMGVMEDGEIQLVFFGQPGVGDAAILAAAEAAAAIVAQQSDPQGRLFLEPTGPPLAYADIPSAFEVPIHYQFFPRRTP